MAAFLEKWQKRRHYQRNIMTLKKKIWDMEFMKEQIKLQREHYRGTYDRLSEALVGYEERLQKLKEPIEGRTPADIAADIEDTKQKIQRVLDDRKHVEEELTKLDENIEGKMVDQNGEKIQMKGINGGIEDHLSLMRLLEDVKKRV